MTAFLQKLYFIYGRIGRMDFVVLIFAGVVLPGLVCTILVKSSTILERSVSGELINFQPGQFLLLLAFCCLCVAHMIWAHTAITTKRLHDLGFSGWWQALYYIPVLDLFALPAIMLALIFMPGKQEANKYGEAPPRPNLRSAAGGGNPARQEPPKG